MSETLDFRFAKAYECDLLDEQPGATAQRHFYYPGGTLAGGGDGLMVRVVPKGGETWFGTFAFGSFGGRMISRVLSMPDPGQVCVVSRGAGYIVDVLDPRRWEEVRAVPVFDAIPIAAAGLVVFANLTELMAYGAEGLQWRTARLAWDGMKLIEVTDETIVGEYWDIRSEEMQRFEVDVKTGAHRGGVESPAGDA